MDCSPPGSSVHGLLQARILKWVVIPISRRSFQPRDRTQVCCIAGIFFTDWATREGPWGTVMVLPLLFFIFPKLTMCFSVCMCVCFPKICSSILYLGEKNMNMKVAQSCPTLCNPMDCPWNSPGQDTRVGSLFLLQEIFQTQGLNPGLPHCRQILYQLSHKGRPYLEESGGK